jgi:hypothetical protein
MFCTGGVTMTSPIDSYDRNQVFESIQKTEEESVRKPLPGA